MAARTARQDAGTALATRRQNGGKAVSTLADDIRRMRPEFEIASPRGVEAAQLIRDAITCLRNTPKLAECDSASVLGALMTCAQLGLRPAVLGHAWPLPFWDSKAGRHRAQLVIGYQGYVELAYRSGRVAGLAARTVFEADQYEVVYRADGDYMTHRPALDGPRGPARLYYARGQVVANGAGSAAGYVLTDPVSVAEMEAHRDRYAMARINGKVIGPWRDDFEAMAHKTMVRRLVKLLPKSADLATALAVDDGVRVDLTPTTDAAEVTDHDQLDQAGRPALDAAPPADDQAGPTDDDLAAMNREADTAAAENAAR